MLPIDPPHLILVVTKNLISVHLGMSGINLNKLKSESSNQGLFIHYKMLLRNSHWCVTVVKHLNRRLWCSVSCCSPVQHTNGH